MEQDSIWLQRSLTNDRKRFPIPDHILSSWNIKKKRSEWIRDPVFISTPFCNSSSFVLFLVRSDIISLHVAGIVLANLVVVTHTTDAIST